MAVWQAKREGLTNFSMLVSHVLVPPAMRLILGSPANRVQGFIAPGHVCSGGGLSRNTKRSAPNSASRWWWAGSSRWTCWKPSPCWSTNWKTGRAELENQYSRFGHARRQRRRAQRLMAGSLRSDRPPVARHRPDSDRAATACARSTPPSMPSGYSAPATFAWRSRPECIAALVMQGLKKPVDCPAFGTRCTPERPMGAPMVSSEGACAAYYTYRRHYPEPQRLPDERLRLSRPHCSATETVLLGHGSGGKFSAELLREHLPARLRQPRASTPRRPGRPGIRRRPPRLHHRFLRGRSRSSSAAAISARSPSTAPSTIWPWAERARWL